MRAAIFLTDEGVLTVTEEVALEHIAKGLSDHTMRRGADFVPAVIPKAVALLSQPSRSLPLTSLATALDLSHGPLVSHAVAAEFLHCSRSTVGRLVARGDLDTVGRRIVVASLTALAMSGRGLTSLARPDMTTAELS
jgi:hypothetical protein